MKVRFSIRAQSDLDDIFAYIAEDSESYAQRTVSRLVGIAMDLGKFPRSGRRVPDNDDPNMRERFHSHYRIAYSIEGDTVHILTIHHVRKAVE